MATTQTNHDSNDSNDSNEANGGIRRSRLLDPVALGFGRPPKRRGRVALALALTWLGLVIFAAIFADWLPIAHYTKVVAEARLRPGFHKEFLGTDTLGRSMLSRLVYGARTSFAVGFGAVFIGLSLGSLLGVLAGYFRGKVDMVIGIFLDALLAFPPLVLLLAVAAMFPPSVKSIVFELSILAVPSYARLARANTLVFAEREFVMAARAMGAKHRRILLKEILPNVLMPLIAFAFVAVAFLMVAEGALSFLGAGIPPPSPSWGGMMASGRAFLQSDPHLVFVPSIVLLITILSMNVIGDWSRRRFDTKDAAL
jgi:peptide/nickel transport system permease protein